MKKRIVIFGLVLVMVLASALAVNADAVPTDTFQNELYDIVGLIIDVPAEQAASHGSVVRSEIVNYPEKKLTRIYEDGARISTPFTGEDFEHVYMDFADEGYPAFLDKSEDNKFLAVETGYSDTQTVSWYYLVDLNGDSVKKDLICVETMDNSLERAVTIEYVSKDANGEEVYTPAEGSPMTYDEYDEYIGLGGYNDGLIYKDEGDITPGHYDIAGNMVFMDPRASYYGYDYNLGYFVEVSNNGGALDWNSEEDVEHLRRYSTMVTNSVTGQMYDFGNTSLDGFWDNGYGIVSVKEESGADVEFLVKLKKPAIITVHLDGKKLKFDQIPVAENGRTLVPLRAIFEAIGATVEWDGATSTVTAVKGDTTVKLTLDSTTAYKNGEQITLDVPARALNGRTLVPVRFIADCFDVNTDWVQEETKVVLTSK